MATWGGKGETEGGGSATAVAATAVAAATTTTEAEASGGTDDARWAWGEFCKLVARAPGDKAVVKAFAGLPGAETLYFRSGKALYLLLLKYSVIGYVEDEASGGLLDTRALFGIGSAAPVREGVLSIVGLERLTNVQMAMATVLAEKVPGDVLEAGVWRGGVLVVMAGMLHISGAAAAGRTIYGADSFAGLPDVGSSSNPDESSRFAAGDFAVSKEEVESILSAYGLAERVTLVEGWFEESLPPLAEVGLQLALLRVDGDLYASTWTVLTTLYDAVVPGGFVIIDDYGALACCRAAVDAFRRQRGIVTPLIWVDLSAVYWRKERHLAWAGLAESS
ncbi:uncharacterized protein AMSG_01966 [Thecamonas trahens ATCC 50062]|uniref:Macrocin O-methyltransferase n=1 Tax=Thecamonas trahens ATCC 50062 TaxID=461836 RepID=A0A0L0DTP1_THETB|nr:hypothetical protein AMSG_01966 [Thecamonas trahens ATCC 50062]KNC55699.1 hypothetical protein AMSG_01966 [Thecamonas trahens ATCC 50062]|eukprot:XP_013761463.1 hypothetical protein AMSG_01966 [Thecamonas trahens ATCC 50062]